MRTILFACAGMVLAIIGRVEAGVITEYSDRATFEAAISGPFTVETFTPDFHAPITSGVLNSTTNEAGLTPGDIQPGVTYSTTVPSADTYFFNIDTGGGYDGGFLDSLDTSKTLTITFDGEVHAVGFDKNNRLGDAYQVVVTLSDATVSTPIKFASLSTFSGFIASGASITSIQIHNLDGSFGFDIDNFTFDESRIPPAVPEPASVVLLGLGGIGMGLAAWRRKRLAVA